MGLEELGDVDPNQEGWHHYNGVADESDTLYVWGVLCVQPLSNPLLTFYMQK